jgi:FkbM family methyltransferase
MWLQIRFYAGYLFRKFALNFFEVRAPRFRLARLQFFYVLSKLHTGVRWQRFADFAFIETVFGKFHLRPKTFDAICASPDFERPDIDRMISLIRATVASGKRVLFLDIGANIGVYSIVVGNVFRNVEAVSIYGFEPYGESHALFQENILANDLTAKVTAFRQAISDREGELRLHLNALDPGSNTVREASLAGADGSVVVPARTLDHVIAKITDAYVGTVLVMKVDVEGAEVSVMEGAAATLGLFDAVFVMVEDFVDAGICDYLESRGFDLVCRLTPYNSFWSKAGRVGVRVDAVGGGGRSGASP